MLDGKCSVCKVGWILLIIGGLNWGLVGFLDWNFVEWLLGSWPVVVRVVYALVGLSAIVVMFSMGGHCKNCKK